MRHHEPGHWIANKLLGGDPGDIRLRWDEYAHLNGVDISSLHPAYLAQTYLAGYVSEELFYVWITHNKRHIDWTLAVDYARQAGWTVEQAWTACEHLMKPYKSVGGAMADALHNRPGLSKAEANAIWTKMTIKG
jgi:hypothetical protein